MSESRFDLCVVLYRAPAETRAFLNSLLRLDREPGFSLLMLDNSPDDAAWCALDGWVDDLAPDEVDFYAERDRSNPGFPRGISRLATWGDAEFIAMLNPDAEFLAPDTLARVAAMFDAEPDVAIQGPRQCDSAGRLVHSGWAWLPDGSGQGHRHDVYGPGEYRDVIDTEMITGSALFCRRSVWEELADCPNYRAACPTAIGPLGDYQHFMDDSTLCAHAFEHGHRIVYRGDLDMLHESGRSAAPDSDYIRDAWATARPEFDRVMDRMGISSRRGPRALS